MIVDSELLENLCRCLAFHAIETELTANNMDGGSSELHDEVDRAIGFIQEAGFDFNDLYPPNTRPFTIAIDSGRVTRA